MQFVIVPDLGDGKLTLSGIAVSAAPLKETDFLGGPAIRIFHSGDNVAYAYEVLNAHFTASDKPQLQTQIRLYREGQAVYEGPVSLLKATKTEDGQPLAIDGQLRLTSFPPGQYLMQVIVSQNVQENKPRVATQTMDFEIRQD